MKQTVSIIVSIMLLLAALCSCTKNTTADDDGKTKTDSAVLKVWTTSDRLETTKQTVEAFKEKNESKNWNVTVTAVDDVKKKMIDDPSEVADVFCLSSEDFNDLYKSGSLCKIEDNDTAVKIRNTEGSVKVATANKSLYAYPLNEKTLVMYYDKSMFNEEEVKQLETVLFKDLGDGKTNLSFDLTSSDVLTSFFLTAGCSLYGEDGNDTTKCDFNSAQGQAAAEYMIDLASNEKFANADTKKIISSFSSGDLGSAFLSSESYDEVKKALGENFAVTRLPQVSINDKDVQLKSVSRYDMYAVNSQSENVEAAMELADYLSGMEAQEALASVNLAPTNMALGAKEDFLNKNDLLNAVVEQEKDSSHEPTVEKITVYKTSVSTFGDKIVKREYTKSDIKTKLDDFVKEITD